MRDVQALHAEILQEKLGDRCLRRQAVRLRQDDLHVELGQLRSRQSEVLQNLVDDVRQTGSVHRQLGYLVDRSEREDNPAVFADLEDRAG